MRRPPTWALVALAGALAGGLLGLLIDGMVDPSESRGNQAFEAGYRAGFILRYAALGAAAFVLGRALLNRSRSARPLRSPRGIAMLAGLVAVIVLGALPVFTSEEPEERERRDFRAGFVDGCTDSTMAQGVSKAMARSYCACLLQSLTRDRDEAGLKRLLTQARRSVRTGESPPPILLRAARSCAGRTGP